MPRSCVVELPDGSPYIVRRLFGRGRENAKIRKNAGFYNLFLAMTPARVPEHPELGNVCPWASPQCEALCLHISGMSHGDWKPRDMILAGRLARRVMYVRYRRDFVAFWHAEIGAAIKTARRRGLKLVVRPNMLSDIDWVRQHPDLILVYPEVIFHDYTKSVQRFERFLKGDFAPNYWLTFSRSELNEDDCVRFLDAGRNVSVIFDTKSQHSKGSPLPRRWRGYEVIDGDVSDLRFQDPRGVPGYVIGLRAKGRARTTALRGFVVATNRSKIEPMVLV